MNDLHSTLIAVFVCTFQTQVDDIVWHGFVNLEQQLLFATMEMSGSDISSNFSQASSLL